MKPLLDYHRTNNTRDGVVTRCKICVREKHLKRAYGLSSEAYKLLLSGQSGKCAICGSTTSQSNKRPAFHVDHCHKTGKIRGLLCVLCNQGLGNFRDNAENLQKAAKYIMGSK